MRTSLSALALVLLCVQSVGLCHAEDGPNSVLTKAVIEGAASEALVDDGPFGKAIVAIRQRTGNTGPVVLFARRIVTFKEQTHCGRVGFIIGQPSAHVLFRDMAGQLNICDDGEPPLQVCADAPGRLVLPDSVCRNGSKPIDTPEVATAIRAALAAGAMTPQQAAGIGRTDSQKKAASRQGADK